jgi:hypothetical protein
VTDVVLGLGVGNAGPLRLGLQAGTDLLATGYSVMGTSPQFSRNVIFATSFPVTGGAEYSLSLTPMLGNIALSETEGASYPDGTLLRVLDGVTVPRQSDLRFHVVISPDPAVPAATATWGRLKSAYR